MRRLSGNIGVSPSWNPRCLSRHVMGQFYLLRCTLLAVSCKFGSQWEAWHFLGHQNIPYLGVLNIINLWRTNPGCQVARATKFYIVVTSICASSVWNLHHAILMAPRVLRPFLDVWKFDILSSLRTQLIRGACAYLKLRVAYRCPIYSLSTGSNDRSQWSRGLRRRSEAARLPWFWVRIPPGA